MLLFIFILSYILPFLSFVIKPKYKFRLCYYNNQYNIEFKDNCFIYDIFTKNKNWNYVLSYKKLIYIWFVPFINFIVFLFILLNSFLWNKSDFSFYKKEEAIKTIKSLNEEIDEIFKGTHPECKLKEKLKKQYYYPPTYE